jgi:hypothetical protein
MYNCSLHQLRTVVCVRRSNVTYLQIRLLLAIYSTSHYPLSYLVVSRNAKPIFVWGLYIYFNILLKALYDPQSVYYSNICNSSTNKCTYVYHVLKPVYAHSYSLHVSADHVGVLGCKTKTSDTVLVSEEGTCSLEFVSYL